MDPIRAIVSCRGRADHFVRAIQTMKDLDVTLVVQYDHDTAELERLSNLTNENLSVVGQPSMRWFNKSSALRFGVDEVTRESGKCWLLFLDSDTLLTPAALETFMVFSQERADQFLVMNPCRATADLTGLLMVHSDAYRSVGGHDSSIRGWGWEDIDLRVRLVTRGFQIHVMPEDQVFAIPHGDDLREKYCWEGKASTLEKNRQKVLADLARWLLKTDSRPSEVHGLSAALTYII